MPAERGEAQTLTGGSIPVLHNVHRELENMSLDCQLCVHIDELASTTILHPLNQVPIHQIRRGRVIVQPHAVGKEDPGVALRAINIEG